MHLRTLLALRPTEIRLLAAALPLVAATRAALCVLPSRSIVRGVAKLPAHPAPPSTATATPAEVAWAVEAASRLVPGATCLTQAVAARLLLHRHGHAAELCVGVGHYDHGGFRAHAWVEHRGRVLLGGSSSLALARMPAWK